MTISLRLPKAGKNIYFVIKETNMNTDERKYHLIEQVMQCTEVELDRVEALLQEAKNEDLIEAELTQRAEQ